MLTIPKRQTRNSPVIVGDSYELAETLAASYSGELFGGLLAKPDNTTALLSMSGYEKAHNAGPNDLNTRRPSQGYASLADCNASHPQQEPVYLTYALPSVADQGAQPQPMAYDRHVNQMGYGVSSVYQPRETYDATSPGYTGYQFRKYPRLSSYNPEQGSPGTHVHVHLDSSVELAGPLRLNASLMFGPHRVPAILSRVDPREHDVCFKYVVTGNAPEFEATKSNNTQVPLRLHLQDQAAVNGGVIDVGTWQYLDGKHLELQPASDFTRKRKASEELQSSAKRGTSPFARGGASHEYETYSQTTHAGFAYPQDLHSLDSTSMQRRLTTYGKAQSQQGLQNDPVSLAYSQSLMRPPITQSSSWSPYSAASRSSRSPGVSAASMYVTSNASSDPANPPLVRSSTIQTQPGSASTSGGSSSDGAFNPYTLYPNRASIKICGKLKTMQDDWSAEERAANRRLVLFSGEQTGSTINTYFRSVKPDERLSPRAARERRISCIYWDDSTQKEKYWVTSVDTIALLETLVGARFTVEEKNRIRRNLETHQPLTISKAKPETENFFKVIMGFPNPKPRNIEKDVKVFPWTALENALKKVISKYSASHSSTAGPLPRPQHKKQTYTHSSSHTDDPYSQRHLSSRSTSSTSSVYAHTPFSATLSPPSVQTSLSYSQPSPMHPTFTHAYTVPTLVSQHATDNLAPISGFDNSQLSIPDLNHAYTSSSIGRRRSSEANLNLSTVPPSYQQETNTSGRPRAHTSFSALYVPQDNPNDYGLQLPTGGQPIRGSWDFSAYLQPENTNIVVQESPQATQYRRASMPQASAGANEPTHGEGYAEGDDNVATEGNVEGGA
ncbi:hypothetical protein P7C71_g3624, partial [Lecanoromycetidae sp. Uapishka_2]